MIKPVIAAVAAIPFMSSAALAGPYVNVENNAGWSGDDYTGAVTDLHVGFEGDLGEDGVPGVNQRRPGHVDAARQCTHHDPQAAAQDVRGAQATPFLLAKLIDATGGDSLKANVALLAQNARLAAEVAIELAGRSDA